MSIKDVLSTARAELATAQEQLIAADAANEGADTETLTIDAIESAIVADLAAGHETPTVANRARLFSAAGSFDARRAEEDHPALCKLLDEAFS